MRQIQNAWAVGDAILHMADSHHVLLIVSSRTRKQRRLFSEHLFNTLGHSRDHFAGAVGLRRMNDHQIVKRVLEGGIPLSQLLEKLVNLILDFFESFFSQKSSIENGSGTVDHAGSLSPALRLSSENRIYIDARMARSGRVHRHLGFAPSQQRLQRVDDFVDQIAKVVGRAHAEIWHAAVPDPAVLNDLEPVHSTMTDADAVDIRWLGDDYEIRTISVNQPALGQVRDTGESTAFLIYGAALLHGS